MDGGLRAQRDVEAKKARAFQPDLSACDAGRGLRTLVAVSLRPRSSRSRRVVPCVFSHESFRGVAEIHAEDVW